MTPLGNDSLEKYPGIIHGLIFGPYPNNQILYPNIPLSVIPAHAGHEQLSLSLGQCGIAHRGPGRAPAWPPLSPAAWAHLSGTFFAHPSKTIKTLSLPPPQGVMGPT